MRAFFIALWYLFASADCEEREIQCCESSVRPLRSTGAYVSGNEFSLADIPICLSINRWFETPLKHPHFPAVSAYYDRLNQREGYRLYGRNGTP